MGTHPTFNPSTGPSGAYQPKTTDTSDGTVAGTVEAWVITDWAQDVRSTGTINSANTTSPFILPVNGLATVAFKISGLAASGGTLVAKVSNDGGTTYDTTNMLVSGGVGMVTAPLSTDVQFRVNAGAHTHVQLAIVTTGTGNVTVAASATINPSVVSVSGALNISQTTPGSSNGVTTVGSSNIAAGSASVTSSGSATQIVAARAGRNELTIINESTIALRVGASGVTSTSGAYLAGVVGASVTIPTAAAVYAVLTTGSTAAAVSYLETY